MRFFIILAAVLMCGCSSQEPTVLKEKYIALSQVAKRHKMKVSWKSREKKAILQNKVCKVIIQPGTNIAWIGENRTKMPLPAYLNNKEVYIPLSFYRKELKPAVGVLQSKTVEKAPPTHDPNPIAEVKNETEKLNSQKLVVIDPGHGGHDHGALGIEGFPEKKLALSISLKLAEYLKKAGAKVVMTRSDDTFIELGKRAEIANSRSADCFVSIHLNSHDKPQANGFEVWVYRKKNKRQIQSLALAKQIHMAMKQVVPLKDRGVRKAGFLVVRETKMPAVLVECGFISNKRDAKWIANEENQDSLARMICRGLVAYLNAH